MTDELDDRLSRRFDDEEDEDTPGQKSQNDRNSQTSQKAQNIKNEWNVRSIYLDDELDEELMMAFKRLDLTLLKEESDIDLKKTRHFYPLIVELGIEKLEEMDVTELTERLESKER